MRNTVVLEKTGSGYSAYLPDLPGCISTGRTIADIKTNIREAVEFHLEGMNLEKLHVPEEFSKEYELTFKMDVASLFEWFSGVLTKSGVSRLTGMNQSLISQYASGIKTPSHKQTKKIEKALHSLGQELLEIEL
ncbi:MAG: type II toxin-antitoxin system HicB family antitoxin [Bacteroidales bacterium]|nr:type II toxin-antitoxin system HicB family antitoxin [Bacteroidales bacterium]